MQGSETTNDKQQTTTAQHEQYKHFRVNTGKIQESENEEQKQDEDSGKHKCGNYSHAGE